MEDMFENEIKKALNHLCTNCSKCEGKFVTTIWDKMPDGCGLEGWLFQEREKEKQKIRRKKEELLDLGILLKTSDLEQSEKINERIEKIKSDIEIYAKYGSQDW